MRIAIFVSEDYDFTFDMMKALIPKLEEAHSVVGVASFPDRLGRYEGMGVRFAYLRIFGMSAFIKLAFRSLVKRGRIFLEYLLGKCPFFSFRGMYRYHGLRIAKFANPNSPGAIKWVKDSDIDVIVLFIGHILKSEIIAAPKICIINKHSGLLPAYRGILPVFWAMFNNDRVGLTIHKVTASIDAGEVILQKAYEKITSASVYGYYKLIYNDTAGLIAESLELIREGKHEVCIGGMPPSSFGLPTRADYLKFRKAGHRFI